MLICLPTQNSLAGRLYIETGGGVSHIRGGETFFQDAGASVADLGPSINATFAMDFGDLHSTTSIHVGAQHRMSAGSFGGTHFGVQVTYPALRIQAKNLFLTVGATPFIFSRVQSGFGIDNYTLISGALAAMLEAGYAWPITPAVSFSLSACGQIMLQNGAISPKPIIEGSAALRFYLWGPDNFVKDSSSFHDRTREDYEGWRYPFGYPK